MGVVVYWLILLCANAVTSLAPRCQTIESPPTWITQDGRLQMLRSNLQGKEPVRGREYEATTEDFKWGGFPGMCHLNVSGAVPCGLCIFCKDSRIVACYGPRVTNLPELKDVTDAVDLYQVSNSDVRVITNGTFANYTITEIDIENNHIRSLSQKAFEDVRGLQVLSLANNNLSHFVWNTVKNLLELRTLVLDNNNFEFSNSGDLVQKSRSIPNLLPVAQNRLEVSRLSLAGNPLRQIPKDAFKWLANAKLEFLNLRGCSVQTAHVNALTHVASTLRDLELSDVTDIAAALFNLTSPLKVGQLARLGLASCGLVAVPKSSLENVAHSLRTLTLHGTSLTYLTLRFLLQVGSVTGNTFQKLVLGDFPEMTQLETLDLRRSSVRVLQDGAFNGLSALRILLLAGNRLVSVHRPFEQLATLRHLDLSGNPDQQVTEGQDSFSVQFDSFHGLHSLESLSLSGSRIQKLNNVSTFKDLQNLTILSLCNTHFNAPSKKILTPLANLLFLDLSGSTKFVKKLDLSSFKGLQNLTHLYITHAELEFISYFDRKMFHDLVNLITLVLNNNAIRDLHYGIFQSLVSLRTLDLDSNRIESWSNRAFENNLELKELSLRSNRIDYVTDAMLEDFHGPKQLELEENPLQCDCNMERFVNITTVVEEGSSLTCFEPRNRSHINLYNISEQSLCRASAESGIVGSSMIVIVSIACGALILLAGITGVAYRKRNNLRYLALMVRNAVTVALEDQEEEPVFKYDVFVSYCSADREWIVQELLPALERDAQLRLCLHERDFEPGYGILDNIIHCMDSSRALLLIVSKHSLRSQWCQFEMHLAQHRLVETRRDRLILALVGDIPRVNRSRTLHYLMATRTYLVWTPDQKTLFFRRLKKALLMSRGNSSTV